MIVTAYYDYIVYNITVAFRKLISPTLPVIVLKTVFQTRLPICIFSSVRQTKGNFVVQHLPFKSMHLGVKNLNKQLSKIKTLIADSF